MKMMRFLARLSGAGVAMLLLTLAAGAEIKIGALLAGSTTATTMAIIPLAEEAQVPLINFAGAVQAVYPVKRWNFKTPHTDLMACEKIFEDLRKRSLSKIALISGTDAFGKSMRD